MDLKIAKIILWPKNEANARREIRFESAGISVITGWSQKGKSALIHIIDYCLGSEKCAIPVGKVRDSVAWFGVLLYVPKGQILLARRNPEDQVQSSEMVIRSGRRVTIPDVPSNPDSRDSVIRQLNVLAGLPPQALTDGESSLDGPPSFRDMAAFQFQPQHIIANPYTLFFKADTSEHREKLVRSVIPYVIGAVDALTLESRARLRTLEYDLKTQRDKLESARRVAAMWLGQLQGFYSTARAHDLIADAPDPESNWLPETYVAWLSTIQARLKENPLPEIPKGATRRAVRELTALRQEYERLLRGRDDRRRKLEKLSLIRSSADGFATALERQAERLAPVGWFAKQIRDSHDCPVCGQLAKSGKEEIDRLAVAADEVAASIAAVEPRNVVFEAEAIVLEKQIAQIEADIRQIETRLMAAEGQNAEMRQMRNRRDFVHGFVGEVKAALESIKTGSDIGKLAAEERGLAREVEKLQQQVNESEIRNRTKRALKSISGLIGHYAQKLGIEHASRRWELDDRSLTLKARGNGERTDFLWEIGSAANWMGFHVATLLALHEHFRSVSHSPVPKFLVLDQPSQAFFPEGVASARRTPRVQRPGGRAVSDDLARLKRVFSTLSDAVVRTNRGLQIIVLEHAEATVWDGVPHVKQIEEWRDKDALIPLKWQ